MSKIWKKIRQLRCVHHVPYSSTHCLQFCWCVVAGLTLTDHTFSVPLDYADESKGTLDIYVREVVAYSRSKQQLPYLLFLQGEQALLN